MVIIAKKKSMIERLKELGFRVVFMSSDTMILEPIEKMRKVSMKSLEALLGDEWTVRTVEEDKLSEDLKIKYRSLKRRSIFVNSNSS